MASRDLDDLHAECRGLADAFLGLCEAEGLPVLVYCTLRSAEEQARLFRQGRSTVEIRAKAEELRTQWGRPDLADLLMSVGPQYGAHVTKAGPGQSLHNYGMAFDGVPLRDGRSVWGHKVIEDRLLWDLYGRLGQSVGLVWGGAWGWDRPHMQAPGVNWRELIREGAHD